MNTLAINRLLRKLEGAIASGHHQQAAGLAKELARLKIHCSVIRQRSAARLKDQSIKVNMYIEDKLAHQGPIPLQVSNRYWRLLDTQTKRFMDRAVITAADKNDSSRAEDKDTYGVWDTHERAAMDHWEKLGWSRRGNSRRITCSGWFAGVSLSRSTR